MDLCVADMCVCVFHIQVRGALFNKTFSVIVSADESGTVCVWNVLNGHREGRFQKAHGDAKVRVCMTDTVLLPCLPIGQKAHGDAKVRAC